MIVSEEDYNSEFYLEHFGVKGMQWGVQKKVSSSERREGRKEVRAVSKAARQALRASRKSNSPAERAAVAQRYEDEVVKRIRSAAFKEKFQNANTMGKGEMAAHVLLLGPFAAVTIPSLKKQYAVNQTIGVDTNKAAANKILKELRSL